MTQSGPGTPRRKALLQFLLFAACLVGLLLFLFRGALPYGRTVFSNDGPLGAVMAQATDLPSGFTGYWQDLNWLGMGGISAPPDLTQLLAAIGGKFVYAKFFAPYAVLIVGLCAWILFRQWKLSFLACFAGAIAAALNTDFLSVATWGVASQTIAFGLNYLALAAVSDLRGARGWIRLVLAGFAVGIGIMEAYDIGAIFSLFVAAYVVFDALTADGSGAERVSRAGVRVTVVAVFAAIIATHALSGLVGTQIKGIAGTTQDQQSKVEKWDWATQWSLPKREVLTMIIPGLFGFRMDTPTTLPESLQERYEGGVYWGSIGRDPSWERYYAANGAAPRPRGGLRFVGSGEYAGVVVLLIAAWAIFQSFRKQGSVFTPAQRKQLWFWGAVIVISILLGFGRFAPFYQFFYALPYVSTIRNPIKFFHVVHWALLIVFAYGVHGLTRCCMDAASGVKRSLMDQVKSWWATAASFDRKWMAGMGFLVVAFIFGWIVYAASRGRLIAYLQTVDFDPRMAEAIANFSLGQVGRTLFFVVIAIALLTVILSGYFSGLRARIGGVLLMGLLVLDLGGANVPWIITYDWKQKYESNPVVEFLREKPYEHRVAMLPFPAPDQLSLLDQLYRIEWAQHLFLYYNIQSLDIVQMPRAPVDYLAFETALRTDNTKAGLANLVRRWELTNTRYLLGAAGFLPLLNEQLDPGRAHFRSVMNFDIVPKMGLSKVTKLEDLTAVVKPDGKFALFEFAEALPRAKLYSHWQINTNDEATLKTLASKDFDPAQLVMVAEPPAEAPKELTTQAAANGSTAGRSTGKEDVAFVSYAPKDIVFSAEATEPSVLLLNDRYDPNWKVFVDGKEQALLRCNYLMRGVYLSVGKHQVEFKFLPPIKTFYVSLGAVIVGIILCGVLALYRPKETGAARQSDSEKKD